MMHGAGLEGIGEGSPVQLVALCFSIGSFLIVTLGLGLVRLAWSQVRENREAIAELARRYERLLELLNDVDKRKLSIPASSPVESSPYRRRQRSRPDR